MKRVAIHLYSAAVHISLWPVYHAALRRCVRVGSGVPIDLLMGLPEVARGIVLMAVRREHMSCVIGQERWHLNCVWHSRDSRRCYYHLIEVARVPGRSRRLLMSKGGRICERARGTWQVVVVFL